LSRRWLIGSHRRCDNPVVPRIGAKPRNSYMNDADPP
jgi:hypothetical protein